jgi:hypothetical protein
MFGHPWPEWFKMRDAAFDFLCRCASEQRLASYGEIWAAVGAALGEDLGSHWRQLPNLLGYVSSHSLDELDLLATALVIYDPEDERSGPGPGFFRLAASKGLLDDEDAPPEGAAWAMSDRQREFWRRHVDAMFDRFIGS